MDFSPTDVNECLTPGVCTHGTCINLEGSYTCRCRAARDANPSRPGRVCHGAHLPHPQLWAFLSLFGMAQTWMCMGSSGIAVLSHTGQVLKREATTGHPALFPPAVVTVGPLTPPVEPRRGM